MKINRALKSFTAMALSAILAFGAAGTAAASTNTDNASAAEFSETEPDRAVAFPGADGAGKFATGGRGGEIYHVTNLNDSGTGSLRDAVSKGRRIVVFDVGGTINLKSDLSISGNISVMGQTAPGGAGVTVRNGKLAMAGDNIIVRYMTSRPGEKGSGEYDAWGGSKGSNSIIDHCSIGWANDEQFGLYSSRNMTMQYSIIGPANCLSTHSKGSHGFGPMFGAASNTWHHNLICHNMSRNFRGKVEREQPNDYVNNVVYGWGGQTAYGTFGHLNYVNNYFKKSISSRNGDNFGSLDSGSNYETTKFFMEGNKMTDRKGNAANPMSTNNWNSGLSLNRSLNYYESHYRASEHFPIISNGIDVSAAKNPESADAAFNNVVSYAGAAVNLDSRNKIDAEVLNDAYTGSGSLSGGLENSKVTADVRSKYSIKYVNYDEYYPKSVLKKEIIDSDNDGMPDDWEIARGLNPNDSSDANGYYIGGAYTNIEHYCNDLTVDSFPEGVVTLSPTLDELGADYSKAIEDLNSLKLSKTKISSADEISLPVSGSKFGSKISWSSSSDSLKIENNAVTQVIQPTGVSNENAYIAADIANGDCVLKKYFTVTILSSTMNWFASSSDNGKSAGTVLADGLSNVSGIITGELGASVSIDGVSRTTYITSDANGGYSDGKGSGTCLKYTAPNDGTLYGYAAELADTKTLYIVPEGVENYKTDYVGMKAGNGGTVTVSAKVKAGNTYYIFPAGTKGKLLGMKFAKKTESSSEIYESNYEKWDFDELSAGTSYAKNDTITNKNGKSISLDITDAADSITIANRSGSSNYLKIADNSKSRLKWSYKPDSPLSGNKVVFEFEFNKSDIEKDTTFLRVYDEINANANNTYSNGSVIFDLKTSSNKGESSSTSSELVLTDYFSMGTSSTDDSPKGVDFGFSNFTYQKDKWYGIRLEYIKNADGKNEVALYTKNDGASKYTYRDSVILGSGVQRPNADIDNLTLTPTKMELMTPGSGTVTIGIDNISVGTETLAEEPKTDTYVFRQNGVEATGYDDSELTCSINGMPENAEYTAAAAEYDSDGMMIGMTRSECVGDGEISIMPSEASQEIKIFVWSDMASMEPLIECGDIKRK